MPFRSLQRLLGALARLRSHREECALPHRTVGDLLPPAPRLLRVVDA